MRLRQYWNFVLQADKVKRQTLLKSGAGSDGVLVPLEAKEQAWRGLVGRYVKQGLDRKVLLSLLFRILTIKLDQRPGLDWLRATEMWEVSRVFPGNRLAPRYPTGRW